MKGDRRAGGRDRKRDLVAPRVEWGCRLSRARWSRCGASRCLHVRSTLVFVPRLLQPRSQCHGRTLAEAVHKSQIALGRYIHPLRSALFSLESSESQTQRLLCAALEPAIRLCSQPPSNSTHSRLGHYTASALAPEANQHPYPRLKYLPSPCSRRPRRCLLRTPLPSIWAIRIPSSYTPAPSTTIRYVCGPNRGGSRRRRPGSRRRQPLRPRPKVRPIPSRGNPLARRSRPMHQRRPDRRVYYESLYRRKDGA